jgi:hypothetical protein
MQKNRSEATIHKFFLPEFSRHTVTPENRHDAACRICLRSLFSWSRGQLHRIRECSLPKRSPPHMLSCSFGKIMGKRGLTQLSCGFIHSFCQRQDTRLLYPIYHFPLLPFSFAYYRRKSTILFAFLSTLITALIKTIFKPFILVINWFYALFPYLNPS